LVIATDSEYLVLGITQRIEKWANNRWRTGAGQAVKNKDLWMALRERMNDFAEHGLEVLFWRIPREQNTQAGEAARRAAESKPAVAKFTVMNGTLV
jgi:ribonuclease HI